ncbi:MAG TPA: GDP-mannose 4,6-dehydratase [Thermoanaerobaculia bacterium]|nr:GDP-mannose 4,6-dehydratase [Thermoanaerobaculia bacterium]
MARILITGITGQDGSYLTESHLAAGDEVHGLVRQSSLMQRTRLDALPALSAAREEGRLRLHYADLSDTSSLVSVLRSVKPDVIYHLAGQSHVKISFDLPEYTADSTGLGTLRLLEALRSVTPDARLFLAATSEIFGEAKESPQSEQTPMNPINPYAAAKVYALNLVRIYRKAYGLFACAGILFNPESPRRGENYVTRKIARAAARIARGQQKELHLGTLEPKRDWSYAPDIVDGIRRIVAAPKPDDFVLASGVSHSVGDFCKAAFAVVGLDFAKHVVLDSEYVRPIDISETHGDASKARRELGWEPKTGFGDLVKIMVGAELADHDGRGDAA